MLDNPLDLFATTKGSELYGDILATVKKFSMDSLINKGVLLGLSGGADSVLLALFLKRYTEEYGTKLLFVHINHMIRGDEALRDEEFSRELSKCLGVEFLACRVDVPTLAKERGIGIEECARDVRYSEFSRIISERDDVSSIAVAHNATDNSETVIMNILRGAGSRGAAGIKPVRDNIFRPLIKLEKSRITEALDFTGVPYVTDSTNRSVEYNRNYIRHTVLPALGRLAPSVDSMLSRLSDNLRSDDDYIFSVAASFLETNPVVYASELDSLHEAVYARVVEIMCRRAGCAVSSTLLSDIKANLKNPSFRYSVKGGEFISDRGVCTVRSGNGSSVEYDYILDSERCEIPERAAVVYITEKPLDKFYLNVYTFSIQVNLGSAIINGRLRLRPKLDGDTVYYGGITRKLKKLYNDRKIPLSRRSLIPVLCDDDGVVCVPGLGVRDDGNRGKGPYFTLCITDNGNNSDNRFYSAGEFNS